MGSLSGLKPLLYAIVEGVGQGEREGEGEANRKCPERERELVSVSVHQQIVNLRVQ